MVESGRGACVVLFFVLSCVAAWADTENDLSLLLRDPSKPPLAVQNPVSEVAAVDKTSLASPAERWQLGLVRFSGSDALAVINGKLIRAGQTIDGLLVESIHRQGVSGRAGNQAIELVMEVNRAAANMTVRASSLSGKGGVP